MLGHLFLWDLWGHSNWPPETRVPQPRKDSLVRLDDAPSHGQKRQCGSWLTSIFTMSNVLVRLTKVGNDIHVHPSHLSGDSSLPITNCYVLKLFPCPGVKEFPSLLLLKEERKKRGRGYFLPTETHNQEVGRITAFCVRRRLAT